MDKSGPSPGQTHSYIRSLWDKRQVLQIWECPGYSGTVPDVPEMLAPMLITAGELQVEKYLVLTGSYTKIVIRNLGG